MSPMNHDEYGPLVSGFVDGELTPEEEDRLKRHLSRCSACRMELAELRELSGVTDAMKNESLPDVIWDRYWLSVYNRLERGVAFVLLSAGAAILLGFALWRFVTELLLDAGTPPVLRVGAALLAAGLGVLTASLVRERLHAFRHDPYKEVKR